MSWKVERENYIKSKCRKYGAFRGFKKEIYSVNDNWFIRHKDQFGTTSEAYGSNLDEAVADYVALEEVYGTDEV